MMKDCLFAGVLLLAVQTCPAGVYSQEDAYARWDETTLTVGNRLFHRTYRADGGVLRTVSFAQADRPSFVCPAEVTNSPSGFSVSCESIQVTPVGETALRCMVTYGGRKRTIDVYPNVAGVVTTIESLDELSEAPSVREFRKSVADGEALISSLAKRADVLRFPASHLMVTEYVVVDQTDVRDNLLQTREWLTPTVELPERLTCASLDVRDHFSSEGLVFLRLAPMPRSRPSQIPDFIFSGNFDKSGIMSLANGYPVAEVLYENGEVGRIEALRSVQRAYRPYRPNRDGLFLSNTWGGGNCDSRINAAFLMKEVAAGAELGVDVIQIDDGWQQGRTANSALKKKGQKGAWNGYWAADPDFWKPDTARFPGGLEPLVEAARSKGMRFGLWFGPDSSNESVNWEKDADCLLDFHRRLGIDYFKLDSIKLATPCAFSRNGLMMDKMLKCSNGDMVFDLDATSEIRPGFFGALGIGPVFVENRYAYKTYRPWSTLRNLWQLAHLIDPVRLRMEVVDPDHHPQASRADDPLASDKWPKDAFFAIAMVASPLGWMELSEIRPDRMEAMKPLVARWKRERAALHGGATFPVGAKPDGKEWTGFLTRTADGEGGYVLLFREMNDNGTFSLSVGEYFANSLAHATAEIIGGRGTAQLKDSGRTICVSIPDCLDFIWVKIRR